MPLLIAFTTNGPRPNLRAVSQNLAHYKEGLKTLRCTFTAPLINNSAYFHFQISNLFFNILQIIIDLLSLHSSDEALTSSTSSISSTSSQVDGGTFKKSKIMPLNIYFAFPIVLVGLSLQGQQKNPKVLLAVLWFSSMFC